jgi:hypothetical protein
MAVMQSRDNRTFIAGEDLSSAQFKFVTLESDGQVDLADSAGENAIGVCIVGAGCWQRCNCNRFWFSHGNCWWHYCRWSRCTNRRFW